MLESIEQEIVEKEGTDCLIKDCYTILSCLEKYIVLDIRRYIGWCDIGFDYRGIKEFDNIDDAIDYYKYGLRKL